jgi:hypothetical protein
LPSKSGSLVSFVLRERHVGSHDGQIGPAALQCLGRFAHVGRRLHPQPDPGLLLPEQPREGLHQGIVGGARRTDRHAQARRRREIDEDEPEQSEDERNGEEQRLPASQKA